MVEKHGQYLKNTYSEDNVYTIDIQNSSGLPSNLYANDLENKLIGATNAMEWKYNEDDEWTSYSKEEPDLTGNKSVIVRMGATGVHLADTKTKTYNFTEDNQPDTQKYISIDRLSVYQVSSEEPGHSAPAQNAIDGNINTIWHSNWNGQDADRYITIKLDKPVYLSALEYLPRQSGSNGRIKNGKILVSMDGSEWTEIATITNWANSAGAKTAVFDESEKAQYVKLVATENYGDGRNFISAAMINLYEDITKKTEPTAEIEYDIKELTNSNVTATLVNPSTDITITNNAGKNTYVFTQNDNFTFEFVDKDGNKGKATATVNWIDKIVPTATISYDIEEETDQPVTAKVSNFSEKVTIINNSGSDTYTFTKNDSFKFEFKDEAGNIGEAIATVSWIKEKSETPDPGEGENPGETPDPGEGENPGETPDPGEGEDPGETPDPGEEEKPGETPDPGEEEKPGETPDPGEGENPGETPDSGEGENPGETPNPGEEEKPGETPDPGEEEKPGETLNPDEEQKTDETEDLDKNQTSNTNKADTNVINKILPYTGTNNSILIIVLGVSIVAGIFYIKLRMLRKKAKHL